MADAFDAFLASSLAPEDRPPDRRFVANVQARILIEDRLARERRVLVTSLATQLLALLAVGAGLWVLGRAAPVATWFAHSEPLGLVTLLVAFGFVVAMFSSSGRPSLRGVQLS
jgi:hypothetical protein